MMSEIDDVMAAPKMGNSLVCKPTFRIVVETAKRRAAINGLMRSLRFHALDLFQ